MSGTTIERRSASVSISLSSVSESLILYSRIASRLILLILLRGVTTTKCLRPTASALVIVVSYL